jgi:TusA-related sulfurtransferase
MPMTIEAAGLPAIRPVGDADDRDPGRDAAERLVGAIAARDYTRLFGVLARDARFRYMIPSGPGQVAGAADVAAKYFEWFGDVVALEVQAVLVQRVSDRTSARYRFLLREGHDWEVVEQQAYLDVDADGRVAAIDLLCSGFRPTDGPGGVSSTGTHEFDAGTMSCADGLASEFRRRIGAIPVGDVLAVTARDPAAKEDLPPLARLMGHTIHSVEAPGDGRLVITVERGR